MHLSSYPRTTRWLCRAVYVAWGLWTIGLSGCQAPQACCDPSIVAADVYCRTGVSVMPVAPCSQVVPPGVVLEDGLSEDEAVHTALANNSAFQATLAQIGMAGGDLIQAGMLANPQMLIYFPAHLKEGQYTLYAPIESFLLRPLRVKVASREYQRVGQQLVQNGLNVARDVRLAYTDFSLASQQAKLAQEALEIRKGIVELTTHRLQEGDISELEAISARVDLLNAQAAAGVQQQAISIAAARLVTLIGLPQWDVPQGASSWEAPTPPTINESQLIVRALTCRPDFHASQCAVAAAADRSRLSRWLFLRLDGVVDVRSGIIPTTRVGSGLRFDVPIFNRNQGGVVRADWELNAALHTRDAIHDQIVLEVRTAARQWQQAYDNLMILRRDVAPALSDALTIARKGFADGATDYLLVLQTASQYLDVRARILDQTAACRRAIAELERSVGCSLEG